jgi:mRNA-degrading endonuclease HigB of HigAB toxin-antitoxin module
MQSRYDPSAIEEDLGDDPVKAGNYGIKNLKYILSNLNQWITDDNDYAQRQTLYSQLLNQYYRYIRNVLYNIGGIYLTEVKEGTPGDLHKPVSKEIQKASLKWVLNEYKNIDWVDNREIKDKTPLKVNSSFTLRDRILRDIKGLTSNLILSAHYSDSPYTVQDFTNDIYNATWSSLLKGTKLTEGDKALQKAMVDMFCEPLAEKTRMMIPTTGFAPSVDEIIAYRLDGTGLVERFADILRQYEDEHGTGSVAQNMDLSEGSCLCHSGCDHNDDHFGKAGYGFQNRVSVTAIDDSESYLQDLAVKSRNLLKNRISGTSGSARTHYQSLLIKLNNSLKDKI